MPYDIKKILESINTKPPIQSLTPRQNDIAQFLAMNSNFRSNPQKDKPLDRDTSGPSVVERIFDIMQRPNYAMAELFDTAVVDKDPSKILGNMWEGFSGREKTTFSEVFQHAAGPDTKINPVAKYGGGLVFDILLDPTTYIGAGLIKGAYSGVKTALKIGGKEVAENAPREAGQIFKLPDVGPVTEKPNHFNLQTAKPLDPNEILQLRATGLDISPALEKSQLKFAPGVLENLPKGLAQGKRLNRPKITEELIADVTSKSPRRNPTVVRKETEQLVASLLPKMENPRIRNIAEEVQNLKKAEKPNPATFTISPKSAMPPVESAPARQFNFGAIGNSETNNAIKIAKNYAEKVLSQPNKFAKPGKTPIVNNPAQQSNLFNRFRTLEKQSGGKLSAIKMMRAAEDYLIQNGFHPKHWDGSEVRLTDVIGTVAGNENPADFFQAFGGDILAAFRSENPRSVKMVGDQVAQAINIKVADNIEKSAPFVDMTLEQILAKSQEASGLVSQPKLRDFNKRLIEQGKQKFKTVDIPSSSLSAGLKLAEGLLGTSKTSSTGAKVLGLQRYIDNSGKELWAPIQEAQTKNVEDIIGTSERTAAKVIGEGNRAAEGFMTRMATWWGQKDIRPMVLQHSLTASNNASARARIYNDLSKRFSPEQLIQGFKVAQGRSLEAPTGETDEITQFFTNAIENLFGSSGLTDEAMAAESVAGRAGILMEDINRQLEIAHSSFKFTDGRIMDDMGSIHDFSEGTSWLKSWQTYNVEDPIEFMFRLETATEQLMHKYSFMDEVAARWGTRNKVGEYNTKLSLTKDRPQDTRLPDGYQRVSKNGNPIKPKVSDKPHRLDGYYFPKDIADQVEKGFRTWDQIYNPHSELVRFLDKTIRAWKSGVTIYAPSHHIRNVIGDIYLSWMAGVNNPVVYNKAAKVLFSQKNRYSDLETVENLVGRNAIANVMTKPGDKIIKTRGGHELTAEQIYLAAHHQGLLIYTHAIEDIFGGELFGKVKPFGGRVQGFARKISENREHFVRLAHFIDALGKSKEKDLSKALYEAGKTVRRWHPDGTDLTDFERRYLRRVFPFYSWTRKVIPLLIESAVLNPGKTLAYSRGMYALQGMMGIDTQNLSDPFPMDQLFPDWIKEKGIGPIAAHGMEGIPGLIAGLSRSTKGFTGEPSGYTVVNPSTPFIDVASQFGGMGNISDPIKGLAEMSSPLFRIPAEISQGTTFNGAPIEPGKYAAENIPIAALFSRVFNTGLFGPTNRGESEGQFNNEALVNLLTALGIRGTGPYEKQAEFEEKDRRREARKARKDSLQ